MSIQNDFERKKIKIGKMLKKYREDVGYTSAFQTAKEINTGYDSIHKLEKGTHLPTPRMIESLAKVYKLNEMEIKDLVEKVNEAKELRKKVSKYEK